MEPVVLIERVDDHDSTSGIIRLNPGESASIGSCRCGSCNFELDLAFLEHVVAIVAVHADHWRLHNQGSAALIVENDAQLCEYMTLEPDGHRPIPYDITRLRDAHTNDQIAIITGAFTAVPQEISEECARDVPAVPDRLARDTKHFAVLAALCGPRLVRGPGAPLPSSTEIAALIHRDGREVTPRAVDSQIDYLLEKLDMLHNSQSQGQSQPGGGRGWKRELLATEAVRRGIVTQADVET